MRKYTQFIAITLLTLLTYIPTFFWMADRWTQEETYYSHGPLIPAISIFLIWLKRGKFYNLPINPSNAGWLFFLSGIAIHLISALWQVYFTSGFSILLTLAGIVLIFLGKNFLRQLWFTILFLSFMIPLPLVLISHLSFKLKILASQIAVAVVSSLGIPAVRAGSIIKTAHSYLIVEDPCSGVQSLIALIALGALLAHLSRLPRIRKLILFFSSIPAAILSNAIRITTLILANEIWGAKIAGWLFHDVMGIAVFLCAFIGLQILNRALE